MDRERSKQIHEMTRKLQLEEARAKEANDTAARQIAFKRRRLLSAISLREKAPYPEPSAFISFAGKRGNDGMRVARTKFEEIGFSVRTGFDPEVQLQEDKLSAIKRRIRGSSVFLGILTPEYALERQDTKEPRRYCPGVWVLEEKGIAEASELPIRLLIHDSILDDFFIKIKGDKLQNVYSDTNFESTLNETVAALATRYHERFLFTYQT